MLSRRRVIGFGLLGAAALAVGGVGLGLRPTTLRQPRAALSTLDPVEYSILAAIADRLAPAAGGFPSASEVLVAESVDQLLATCDPAVAAEIKQVLRLVENALPGLLLDGRFRTFTGSSPDAQDQVLENMRRSRLHARRAMYKALSGLVAGAYYASPQVWSHVGYPGPPAIGAAR